MIKKKDRVCMDKEAWVGKSCGALAFALTFLLLFVLRQKVRNKKSLHAIIIISVVEIKKFIHTLYRKQKLLP
jgi:hypothetical protein